MLYGFLNLSVWGYVGAALVLTQLTIASVTIFLHRHQAHHSLTLHPIASHSFRLWLWLTTGIVTREWVAVHRKHHAKCETADDPHSPQIKGIWTVLFRGAGLYRTAKRDADALARFGKGTADDWLERRVYGRFPYLGPPIMASIDLLLFGAPGLAIFAVQMVWIPFWAAGVVNGLAHFWGYRNFETTDASHNLLPFGLLIGGEELHNNHHAYPQSARLSSKWWEIDIGWLYIRTLTLLRLARVRRVAPTLVVARNKQQVDADTLRAVLHGRQRIITLYDRKVIRPIMRSERRTGRAAWQSPLLETAYRYKIQLSELWGDPGKGRAKRLKCLQDWCAEAERSGIEALEEFVRVLRSCTLRSA